MSPGGTRKGKPMSLLEESPASPAAPAAEPTLERPHFSVDFRSDSAEPSYTSYNEAADSLLDRGEPAPSAPTEEPPAQAPEPESPTEPASQPEPRNLAAVFEEIGDDEFREQLRSHPRLKRYLDGELGSRIAAEREAIRQAAIAEHNEEVATFNAAWTRYQEIEALRIEDPETFEATYDNTTYAAWVADVLRARDHLIERQAVRPQKPDPAAPNVEVLRQEWSDDWNTRAIAGVHQVLSKVPDVNKFPQDIRRKLAALQLNENGNWVQEYTDTLLAGMRAAHAKEMKEAVEAARIAGRNEAGSLPVEDRPLQATSRPGEVNRSDDEILIEHSMRGHSTWVTREMLAAVYKRRGL